MEILETSHGQSRPISQGFEEFGENPWDSTIASKEEKLGERRKEVENSESRRRNQGLTLLGKQRVTPNQEALWDGSDTK